MSETVDLVVTRPVAGQKRGDIVTVSIDDERWANHILAGNAVALAAVADAVAQSGDVDEHGDIVDSFDEDYEDEYEDGEEE